MRLNNYEWHRTTVGLRIGSKWDPTRMDQGCPNLQKNNLILCSKYSMFATNSKLILNS